MDRISVAICTYNGEKYIRCQLESILIQTVPVDEIIICDDNSSDQTVEICNDVLKDFEGKKIIVKNQKSLGVSANFTKAFNLCSGDIIFSCDQDDVWRNDKVEIIVRRMDRKTVLAFSDANVVDAELNRIGKLWDSVGLNYSDVESLDKYQKRVLRAFCVTGATMAFRKSLWDHIQPVQLPCLHDIWISALAPFYGNVIAVPDLLIEYRRHSTNVTQVGHKNEDKTKRYKECFCSYYSELRVIAENNQRENKRNNKTYSYLLSAAVKFHHALRFIRENNRRVSKIMVLSREYMYGRYQIFRGGWKLLILDLLFIIKNTNDEV